MSRFIDITGQKFGRLLVLSFDRRDYTSVDARGHKQYKYYWSCLCACGNKCSVEGNKLKSGHTRSCGCLALHILKERSITHGMTDTVEYKTWESMKARCYNKNDHAYKNYGGRGIILCDSWKHSFEGFFKDMGLKPKGLTLDRIDNNGDYNKENCRWSSPTEQAKNRRSNIHITINGIQKCLSDWCKELGLTFSLVRNRQKRNWSIACALWAPSLILGKGMENFARHKRELNALKY